MCGSGLCGPSSPASRMRRAAAPECADRVPRVDRVLSWRVAVPNRDLVHPSDTRNPNWSAQCGESSSQVQTNKTGNWLLLCQHLLIACTIHGEKGPEPTKQSTAV